MSATALSLPRRFASLVKFEHTVFALPFAYVGAFLAVDGYPGTANIVWLTLAMIGARTLAMALNRLIDAELDARNPRTASREIPAETTSGPCRERPDARWDQGLVRRCRDLRRDQALPGRLDPRRKARGERDPHQRGSGDDKGENDEDDGHCCTWEAGPPRNLIPSHALWLHARRCMRVPARSRPFPDSRACRPPSTFTGDFP